MTRHSVAALFLIASKAIVGFLDIEHASDGLAGAYQLNSLIVRPSAEIQ